jgi:hypothetical protein
LFTSSNSISYGLYVAIFQDSLNAQDEADKFAQHSEINFACPDFQYFPASNDPNYPQQWYVPQIRADQVWNNGAGIVGSPDIKIAVIDYGFDYTHADLAPNVWTNPNETPGNGIDDDGNGYIDDYYGWDWGNQPYHFDDDNVPQDYKGHGSEVAGVVAAETNNGVSYNGMGMAGLAGGWYPSAGGCKIMDLKAGHSTLFSTNVIFALEYAARKQADVIVMAFYNFQIDPALEAACSAVFNNCDIPMIAPAGNNFGSVPRYPAADPWVLGVAGTDQFDRLATWQGVEPGSCYGYWVDICAPATGIFTARPSYTYIVPSPLYYNPSANGTSLATAMTAGIAGLVKTYNPTISAPELYHRLRGTSVDVNPINYFQYWAGLGSGRVDAYNAVYQSAQPSIILRWYTINDGGDGKVNPGERIRLLMNFTNVWQSVQNVSAEITDYPANVTLISAVSSLGNIGTDQTVGNTNDPFIFDVATTFDPYTQNPLTLTITLTGSGGYSQTRQFVVAVEPNPSGNWPYTLNPNNSSPVAVDVNQDGVKEIVIGTPNGTLVALNSEGSVVRTYNTNQGSVPMTSPAAADLEHDGDMELVAAGTNGYLYIWDVESTNPRTTINLQYNLAASPTLVDLDADGHLEIVIGIIDDGPTFPLHTYVYAYYEDGLPYWQSTRLAGTIYSTALAGDDNGDGYPDIWVKGEAQNGGTYKLIGLDGTIAWENNGEIQGDMNMVLADVDCDGSLELIHSLLPWSEPATPTLIVADAQTGIHISDKPLGVEVYGPVEGIVPANFDNDNNLEILYLNGNSDQFFVWKNDLETCQVLRFPLGSPGRNLNMPLVADMNNDGIQEALFMTKDGHVYCVDPNLNFVPALSAFTTGVSQNVALGSAALIERVTNSDHQWIAAGSTTNISGVECAWETNYQFRPEDVQWGMAYHDRYHSSLYEQPVSGSFTQGPTFRWYGNIRFDGTVTIPSNTTLIIDPGTIITITSPTQKLVVQGTLDCRGTSLDPIIFRCKSGVNQWAGIELLSGSQASHLQHVKMSHGDKAVYVSGVTLTNPISYVEFTDCVYPFYLNHCSLSIDHCTATGSSTGILCIGSETAVSNCTITDGSYGFWAEAESRFSLTDNTFTGQSTAAIYSYLSNATLEGNSISSAANGIVLNNSSPRINSTYVDNCTGDGMGLYHNSQPVMNLPQGTGGTNRLAMNGNYQLYIEGFLFPFVDDGHNDFVKSQNQQYFIYSDFTSLPRDYSVEADYNWWGGITTPRSNIYPPDGTYGGHSYSVVITQIDQQSNTNWTSSLTEDPLQSAMLLEIAGNFQGALVIYQAIVDTAVDSPVGLTALQRQFGCYDKTSGNFATLLAYYQAQSQTGNTQAWVKTCNDLISYCQVRLQQFQPALEYYEGIINNHQCLADSIYAVIDAGAAYLEMELSGFTIASMPGQAQLQPTSFKAYQDTVGTLLSKLSSPTNSAGLDRPLIPQVYALHQNYPNPFNPSTTIKFDLPEMSQVKIGIYNVLGQQVAVLMDGVIDAGYRQVNWDMTNSGNPLASGMYIYRIEAKGKVSGKNFVMAKKMLMLK